MHINLFTVLGFLFIIAVFAFIAVPWYRRYKAGKNG